MLKIANFTRAFRSRSESMTNEVLCNLASRDGRSARPPPPASAHRAADPPGQARSADPPWQARRAGHPTAKQLVLVRFLAAPKPGLDVLVCQAVSDLSRLCAQS